ncbi:MAG TPA: PadR family transcriptional regulator [Bacillota bacterium]|nr:PadR family transcriptional regulator [Bacillota bacterium]HPE38413.1 PadR family transcriptional regulator [Bacillota bacterium]
MNVQFKKGVLDLCVLSMLKDSDCYGYELANTLSELIKISDGAVYPLLRKLASDGFVTTYLQESQSGPPRKYYSLTAMGQKQLKELMEEWISFTESVNKIVGGTSS